MFLRFLFHKEHAISFKHFVEVYLNFNQVLMVSLSNDRKYAAMLLSVCIYVNEAYYQSFATYLLQDMMLLLLSG